ncbi:MAG: hypothetical protein IJU52_05350 [Clostridia bacterium]|nr:hypothetical protein [Clostridia bacterium]
MLALNLLLINDDNDRSTVEVIFRTYQKEFMYLALSLVHSREDAERAWRAVKSLRGEIVCDGEIEHFVFGEIRLDGGLRRNGRGAPLFRSHPFGKGVRGAFPDGGRWRLSPDEAKHYRWAMASATPTE